MNPGTEEASVTISLSSGGDIVPQPEELVGLTVPAGTARTFSLNEVLTEKEQEVGGVSAIVQSTNAVPIVAERSIRYNGNGLFGSAAEVGAPRSAEAWLLPAAALNPSTDTVVVMNPGSAPATLDLELLFDDKSSLSPAELQGRELPPGGRLKLGIGKWTRKEVVMIRLTSTSPVVAERFSYSELPNDVGAVMGFPLN
jgi:hypothetical protein